MPEDELDEQRNMEDLPLRRPTSFAKAYATTKIGATKSLAKIEEWAEKYQDEIDAAVAAGQQEQEDKNFWGKLATWGTTLGCALVTGLPSGGTSLGGCVALGTAVGVGTRYGVDKGNDWEDAIPQAVEDLDVRYYRDKIPEIAEEINDAADNLQEWNDNMWKADLLAQLGDSWSAYQMGSTGTKMAQAGIFGEGIQTKFTDAAVVTSPQDPLIEDIYTNINELREESKTLTELIKGTVNEGVKVKE